jgi:hypothetical protein
MSYLKLVVTVLHSALKQEVEGVHNPPATRQESLFLTQPQEAESLKLQLLLLNTTHSDAVFILSSNLCTVRAQRLTQCNARTRFAECSGVSSCCTLCECSDPLPCVLSPPSNPRVAEYLIVQSASLLSLKALNGSVPFSIALLIWQPWYSIWYIILRVRRKEMWGIMLKER